MKEKFFKFSIASIITAIFIVFVQIIFLVLFLHPDRLLRFEESYLLGNPRQDFIHLPYKIAKTRREYDSDALKVYLLGGSTIRYMPGDEEISVLLSEYTGRNVQSVNFGHFSQTMLDGYMTAAALPIDNRSVVLISLSVNNLDTPPDKLGYDYLNNMPFVWRYANTEDLNRIPLFSKGPAGIKHLFNTTGIEYLNKKLLPHISRLYLTLNDVSRFLKLYFGQRLQISMRETVRLGSENKYISALKTLFSTFSKKSYERYAFTNVYEKRVSKKRLAKYIKEVKIPEFRRNKEINYEILEKIVKMIQGKGGKVIFFFGAWSPMAYDTFLPILPQLSEDIASIIRKYEPGIALLTSDNIYSNDEWFMDLIHLNEEGLRKTARPFSLELAGIIDRLNIP